MDPNKRRRIGGSDASMVPHNVSFDSDEESTGPNEPVSKMMMESVYFPRCTGKLPTGIFDSLGNKPQLDVDFVVGAGYRTLYHEAKFSPVSCKTHHPACPIVIKEDAPMPPRKWFVLPKVDRDEENAVFCRKHFVLEFNSIPSRSPAISKLIGLNHHTSNHTNAFATWFRKKNGCYMMGNSSQIVHSEVFEHDLNNLVMTGIGHGKEFIQMKNGVFNLGGHPFVLCNGQDPKGIIKSLCLKKIFYDTCFKDGNGKAPSVIERTDRGNRGIDVGRTGGQSQSTKSSNGIAEPNMSVGSDRYPRLWVAGSELATILSQMGGFPRPMSDKKRNQKYSCKIHDKCFGIEHMTIITMVHDNFEQRSIVDLLQRHLDRGNDSDPLYNFVICAWDTFFVLQLGRHITMVIVWTTRKSISDHIKRESRTKKAGDILIKRYKEVPKNLRIVNKDTLPNQDGSKGFEVLPVHFDPLVDLSPYIHWVVKFNRRYNEAFDKGLPTYIVDDMAYAFFMTNNRLRFNDFCKTIYKHWLTRLSRFPVGKNETFSTMFIGWMMDNFGCVNGTQLTKMQVEEMEKHGNNPPKEFTGGVTRHQPMWNNPAPKQRVLHALHLLHSAVNEFIQQARYGQGDCKALFKELQKKLLYLGELNAVKLCFMLAGVGRLPREVLKYGQLGSDHLSNFKGEPWFLETRQHVDQVARHLSTLSDGLDSTILISKIDEFFCQAVGSKQGKAVYIRGQPLWSVELNGNRIEVKKNRWNSKDGARLEKSDFQPLDFSHAKKDSKKSPRWVQPGFCYRGKNYSPVVLLCHQKSWHSRIEGTFEGKKKMVKLNLEKFSFSFLSDLCFNGQIFAVSDPLGMVADEYGLTNHAVEEGVVVKQTNHGFTAQMEEKLVEDLPLADTYRPVGEKRHQTPTVGLAYYDPVTNTAYYHNKWQARLSVYYNLLFNHRHRYHQHLSRQILSNCQQYILVFPSQDNKQGHGLMYCVVSKHKCNGPIQRRPLSIHIIDYKDGILLDPTIEEHT